MFYQMAVEIGQRKLLKGAGLVSLAFLLAIGASGALASLKPGFTGRGTSNVTFESLKFTPLFDANGPKRAIVFGDPTKGAHGFYLKLPPNWSSSNHYHSATYHAILIDGEVINNYEGQTNEVRITKGGYFSTLSNVNHVTKCVSKTECIIYVQMDTAFDAPSAH